VFGIVRDILEACFFALILPLSLHILRKKEDRAILFETLIFEYNAYAK
jgi:hypothetical protein